MITIHGKQALEWSDAERLGLRPGMRVWIYSGGHGCENNAEPARLVKHKQLGANVVGTIDRWTRSYAQIVAPEYLENGYIVLQKPTVPLPNPFKKEK